MLPPNQGFRADHLAGAHVDFGLVIQDKLPGRQGLANMLDILVASADDLVLAGVEHAEAVATRQLGLVHRLSRLAQKHIGVHILILRIESHARAGRNAQHRLADLCLFARGRKQAVQGRQACAIVFEIENHRGELVSAQPGQRIAFPQGALHSECQVPSAARLRLRGHSGR